MTEMIDYFDEIGAIAENLSRLGLKPVLVGGMALVVLGSERVTRDFDFVISKPDEHIEDILNIFYDRGLELASKLDKGRVISTIDSRKVAGIRLQLDQPSNVHFYHPKTGLRIDLMFDFPIAAAELFKKSSKTKLRSQVLHVASEDDLVRMKEIAASDRTYSGDAQDLEFLKKRRK